jgi:hypothetical protein
MNTWDIGYKIEEKLNSYHGTIFENLYFSYDGYDEDKDDGELDISISGEFEHPMSGYMDSYNTAIEVEGKGKITPDGKISIKGTYKMEVGTATYIDELDELRKIPSTAKVDENSTEFDWTAKDADDFIGGLEEIPQ